MTRLLEFVTVQEEKYEERLSPHSNFYCRYIMVQQFLQIQLRYNSGATHYNFSINIARLFGKG